MRIEPKVRGFICTTAHPTGCYEIVKEQAEKAKALKLPNGPRRVLVIGSSMGYGLSSRIVAAFASGAATVGVMYDKPASGSRTASAGWYNTAAFHALAGEAGIPAVTINGDAFSESVKQETIKAIKDNLGSVDTVIYSLASPRRTMPDGSVYSSVLKTVGAPYTNKTVDLKTGEVHDIEILPANEGELAATIKVMGGEDWEDWIKALHSAGVLESGAITVAYSYIGPKVTHAIYRDGSIGRAKAHLHETAEAMRGQYGGLRSYISVNKALVTQSSSAIPVVPLYISLLYRVMKEAGSHEGCIEQALRLFSEKLYAGEAVVVDENGLIRLDDYELQDGIQQKVAELWEQVNSENIGRLADMEGYWQDFYQLFGFRAKNVDYEADVETDLPINGI